MKNYILHVPGAEVGVVEGAQELSAIGVGKQELLVLALARMPT